jgi:hypothetical protein
MQGVCGSHPAGYESRESASIPVHSETIPERRQGSFHWCDLHLAIPRSGTDDEEKGISRVPIMNCIRWSVAHRLGLVQGVTKWACD